MQKFQLELLFQIIGIGSASGLFFKNDSLFLISDNSKVLYEYGMTDKKLDAHILLENPELPKENIPKKLKPDFESITPFGEDLCVFGSGSTENRNQMVQFNTYNKNPIKTLDLTDLYLSMQYFAEIKPEDFNIEGSVFDGENWYFFQRGNGEKGQNGVFTVSGKNLENQFTILYNSYKLPKIKGVQTTFTDAILVENTLYFLATAEDSKSTYEDGAVLGSIIGSINTKTMKIKLKQTITNEHKFEGLTLYKNNKETLEFLLCEDKDSDVQQSDIYKLTLKK
ncbi:DUF6929 family protein [Flavobacterium soli]|uniref:DUF6929 family protein n=1 Tax=Flavobacterium soli TaxID=344881 RepID=UPI0003F51018|nr:hypothetical protein [Flavobacterium soli]